jgi:hypothetical protein
LDVLARRIPIRHFFPAEGVTDLNGVTLPIAGTVSLTGFFCFGFRSSRFPRFWPFAMIVFPSV